MKGAAFSVVEQIRLLIEDEDEVWAEDTGPMAEGARLALAAVRKNIDLRFAAEEQA